MADNTPKAEESKPVETKPVEEKPAEATKPAEEKKEEQKEEKKAEAKPASSASTTDETPDVSHSEEYKTMEEDETALLNVYVHLVLRMGPQGYNLDRKVLHLQSRFRMWPSLELCMPRDPGTW
jgi:hypothetical protein